MITNEIKLIGVVQNIPVFSHIFNGCKYYTFTLAVSRTSGIFDFLPIMLQEKYLHPFLIPNTRIAIEGYIRAFNIMENGESHLHLCVRTKSISKTSEPDCNLVILSGAVCKDAVFRTTPLGKEILDFMLCISHKNSRCNYIPCIAWSGLARHLASIKPGYSLFCTGRLQSRDYIKRNSDGSERTRRVYEVSCSSGMFCSK